MNETLFTEKAYNSLSIRLRRKLQKLSPESAYGVLEYLGYDPTAFLRPLDDLYAENFFKCVSNELRPWFRAARRTGDVEGVNAVTPNLFTATILELVGRDLVPETASMLGAIGNGVSVSIEIDSSVSGTVKVNFSKDPCTPAQMNEASRVLDTAPPKPSDIFTNYLKRVGGKDWFLGNEALYSERLNDLQAGREVDILTWNCLGFRFEMPDKGRLKTTLLPYLDVAIVDYFVEQYSETIRAILALGVNAKPIILLPTNEGLADEFDIWEYTQSLDERKAIFAQVEAGLRGVQEKIYENTGIWVSVLTWEDYLAYSGSKLNQNDLIGEGIKLSEKQYMKDPQYKVKVMKQISDLMKVYGLDFSKCDQETQAQLIDRQVRFKGVYLGEGIASVGALIGGRAMLWLNLESAGVKEDQYVGANGNTVILTPVSGKKRQQYYVWKRKNIANRYN